MAAATADVVIVGGGLVGASLAIALGGSGLQVRVVDPVTATAPEQPSYDDRSTALSPTSRRILEALELWPAISGEAAPIRTIHVSDRGGFGVTRMQAEQEGLDALGHVVPNRVLGRVLRERLAAQPDAVQSVTARVESAEPGPDAVHLTLDDGTDLAARVVVAADGTRSALRERLGIDLRETDYDQVGVVANVTPARSPDGRAFERFTPEGPLALLPLAGGHCSLVWTVSPQRAEALAALGDADFLAALQEAFGYRLGRFLRVGRRVAYPLGLSRSARRVAGRSVLIGNAARTLHPVAGQGFNLALRDVAELAERLHGAGRRGEDPGAPALLQGYADARESDHRRVTAMTDGLVRLFSNRLPGLRLARNLGLVGMELLPGARDGLVRQAMGRGSRLPRLARGLSLESQHG
ncbi:2-octaprenyl-6-methoxyphenyl hydroxylase [Aquisalimonas asiatica]|uniref:2-octaprenyl-6-methoxyphenol hydroxylase n=1 Tax=Aquisalimonas asiatica TaxID=406100 RepID=A0A1H8VKJ3_9GAMM|nr:2-octaprenyl-6-methoxyphenyl hydroxylase [Aquisalimonas asiatica]SEP15800.1 2-octaprenyl-6-methoxyphenol hydroxylase [Aquisalimonas asiatica]